MAEDGLRESALALHIDYLEEEVKKLDQRAEKLEAMIVSLESAQKKVTLRELVARMRDDASEYRKYIKLMKQK